MKLFRWLWLALTLGLLANGFRVAMFVVPPDKDQGDIARIFYYHFPSWCGMSLFFAINLGASIAYLALRNKTQINAQIRALKADSLALATAEMGVVFCTIGMVTGSIWARPVWGIWWTWDARLTSITVLWLIYVAYLLLRQFASGPQMQTLAAVMSIFAYIDVPIVYMSTRWWRTQHPGPVIGNGKLDASMWPAVWWNLAGWLAWGIFVVSLRYAAEQRHKLAEQRAALQSLEAA